MPLPSVRSAVSSFWRRPERAHASWRNGTPPRVRCRVRACRSCLRRRWRRAPEAVAVVFASERLSYRELDARSSQLAHHLRGLGVGPEVVVGLCLERSPAMVVGLLGILKAGGAYLPLDPDYPAERLAFMLADAGARVLVTAVGADRPAAAACGGAGAARCRRRGDRARARQRARASRSIRTTPPMSSTPRAPPERRRASWSRITACPNLAAAQIDRFADHLRSARPSVRAA